MRDDPRAHTQYIEVEAFVRLLEIAYLYFTDTLQGYMKAIM